MRADAHKELLQEFNKRTSERAFFEIFQLYQPVVFSLAYGIMEDHQEAQDITQEVFIRLWQATDQQFAEHINLKRYLMTITRNACIDVLRKLQLATSRRKELLYLLEKEDRSFIKREEINAEIVERLYYDSIEKLPRKARDVYKYSMLGLTMSEIATKLKISISTVNSQKARATELLKKALVENGLAAVILAVGIFLPWLNQIHFSFLPMFHY
jgi:RNA polymerase sigma-70 factor (ECF subfamily)